MYLFTLNPETEYAVSRLVADETILRTVTNALDGLTEGESFQVRRTDYMDGFEMEAQSIGRPDLFVIQGGMSGRMTSSKPYYEEVDRVE